ncbi:hypothetical protein INR79_24285 [Vibrio sp. SCSIO 43132]|uniref:hypothetical protein n=1 Tax=Vibrio sp. SCSIO 43132 TaxID=2779363 RepID=UPI001CA97D4D|nr:hypothetical protein [Vibrio sp. SCSIO 43132]UAB72379.1 hypothetical protein INR79_24285 [Vibrio sp. SCSIO 43132]
MTTEYAIYKHLKTGFEMFISWFKKNECLDPDAMDVELDSIRLVNHGTAVAVTLAIRNHGHSELKINQVHTELSIANYACESNPVITNLVIPSKTHQGATLKFIVPTPFLTSKRAIKDISQVIEHDLVTSDTDVQFGVNFLELKISRGYFKHTVLLDDIRNHTHWKQPVRGLHYYAA